MSCVIHVGGFSVNKRRVCFSGLLFGSTSPHFALHRLIEICQLREENPDMKITEMSKVLGERWRGMDDKAKAPHQKKADADKAR